VPVLILASTLLLAVQPVLRRRLQARGSASSGTSEVGSRQLAGLFVAACYGGYFGAGLGIVLLAVTGLYLARPFQELNALKQLLSVVIGLCSAAFLAFTPHVDWSVAAWMAPGSLLGGAAGGRLVGRVNPSVLRATVVVCGTIIGVTYLWREWR
jgi:hypothetical protein